MASGTIKAVVGRSDIVNNLTTNDSTKVLSAAQGKALKDAADTLNSNIENGHLAAKYLNDTSKTASQLLAADFSNVNLGDIQFYRIRPSDDNLYGFIVKHSATYAYGLFAGMNTGDSYNIVNLNGTWTKTKLALDSRITTNEVSPFFTIDSTKITIDNSSNCHKAGNIVCISLDITAKNEVNGTAYIGTLAESIKPRKSVYGVLCDYTNKTTVTPFALQADGRFIVYNLVSGHEFLGSVCYEVE